MSETEIVMDMTEIKEQESIKQEKTPKQMFHSLKNLKQF